MPTKVISRRAKGEDQLGNSVGLPREGDLVKFHVKAAFFAKRPKLQLGKIKFLEKRRPVQFISTHIIGDTAFVEIKITSDQPEPVKALDDIVGFMRMFVHGMQLGEVATFTLSSSEFEVPEENSKLCKGHYATLGEDADELMFEIDLFRIVRGGKEHRCRNRYGQGARIPGSYSMSF